MRKQEAIHLHALAVELEAHLVERAGLPTETDGVDGAEPVRPTAIHHRKEVHIEALKRITAGVARAVESDPTVDRSRERPRAPD